MTALSIPKLRPHFPFIVLFGLFLITGFSIYKDYGISWDEMACRNDMAITNYKFILKGDYGVLNANDAKYHGPAFELLLYPLEKIFGLKDTRDIFLMRHLVTFLLFAFSLIFFYLFCYRYFKSTWLSVTASAILILSPRIFADAFYNVKDLAFLSMVIISLYSTLLFFEKKNIGMALLHALVCSLVVDIRIMGIIIPAFTMVFLLVDFLQLPSQRKKITGIVLVFLHALAGFIILFWPILWRDPVGHFISAFRESSKYPWPGSVLFYGKTIPAVDLPWYYIPAWFINTTPVLYILLFIAGIVALGIRFIRQGKMQFPVLLNLYVVFVPVISVIILESVLYDGWRHLYYIYPSFVFIATVGIHALFANERFEKWKHFLISGFVAYGLYIVLIMVRLHPYENLYFNFIAGSSLKEIREKFEMDYWCLGYKDGIEYVLKNDTSSYITLSFAEPPPGMDNAKLFDEKEKARLGFTLDRELSDYTLTAYRFYRGPFNAEPVFNIVRDHANVHSVFDIRPGKLNLNGDSGLVASFSSGFEGELPAGLSAGVVRFDNAYSGKHVLSVEPGNETGFTFGFNPPENLTVSSAENKYCIISFRMLTEDEINAKVMFQADSANGKTYRWDPFEIQSTLKNSWIKKEIKLALPPIYSKNDLIKIYLWNQNKNKFYIDDWSIRFYSFSPEVIQSIKNKLP